MPANFHTVFAKYLQYKGCIHAVKHSHDHFMYLRTIRDVPLV